MKIEVIGEFFWTFMERGLRYGYELNTTPALLRNLKVPVGLGLRIGYCAEILREYFQRRDSVQEYSVTSLPPPVSLSSREEPTARVIKRGVETDEIVVTVTCSCTSLFCVYSSLENATVQALLEHLVEKKA